MRTLGILFYTAMLVMLGFIVVVFSIALSYDKSQPFVINYLNQLLHYTQMNIIARTVLCLSGLALILISLLFAQLILGLFQREKTIAFKTSSGEVTIALSAVEDLIRRLVTIVPQVKELRPDVRASKKGIIIELKVTLKSETNIPELTERLEAITKAKIQEIVGLEEKILINTHIVKIATADERDKRKREAITEEPHIPFSGYTRS